MHPESYAVHVHAGAHCGGAEDFQRFLSMNRSALAAARCDLAYSARGGAADGRFDCTYPEARDRDSDLAPFATGIAERLAACDIGGGDRLILSDHDLPGRMANLLGGRFYPAAGLRAAALRQALGRPVDRLVLVVQPYEDLFLSAWRRFSLDRVMEPFAEYAPMMAAFSGGWIETVEALRTALEARAVTILAERPAPLQLMSALVPGLRVAEPQLPAPTPVVTDSAVAMVQRHYKQGARFMPGQRDRIVAFHARQPQIKSDYGFCGLQLADLRGRYVADLDTLARMPGVEMYGGMMPAMAAE